MALVKIGKAAELLGVEVSTLRKWEASGELIPDRKSQGGVRYYDMGKILGLSERSLDGRGGRPDLILQAQMLLRTIDQAQLDAMKLYASLLEERDAPRP